MNIAETDSESRAKGVSDMINETELARMIRTIHRKNCTLKVSKHIEK